MTRSTIEFVDRLEDEFSRISREHGERAGGRRRSRTVAVTAVLVTCLTGGAALAVSGAFRPDDPTASAGRAHGESAVLVTGTHSTGTPWQLLGAREGDSFCLALRLGAERAARPSSAGQCGGLTPGTFVLTAGGTGETPHAFGTLPDEAATLVLAGSGESRTAIVAEDKRDLPGKFFVVEIPPVAQESLTVTVRDGSGNELASASFQDLLQRSAPY